MTELPILDWQDVLDRLDGDSELFAELFELFRVDYPRILGEISDSIEAQDGKMLRESAHAIKGALRNIGAKRAGALAEELERLGKSGTFGDALDKLSGLRTEIDQFLIEGLLRVPSR